MTAMMTRGERLDIEIAVAMEIGTVRLQRAAGLAAREAAVAYNLDLWRTIRQLAATAPLGGDHAALQDSAAMVANRPTPEVLAERNRAHTRSLAASGATHGTLRRLLDEWRSHLGDAPKAEFSRWLLDRMEGYAAPISMAA